MPLTIFMAICILGCDVLIYFFFQWTLGERNCIKRRRYGMKRRVASGQETELFVMPALKRIPARRAKVLPFAKNQPNKPSLPACDSRQNDRIDEEMIYRRRAAAFASQK